MWRRARWGLALGLARLAFHVARAGGRPYQPVEIGGRRFDNVRDSDVRWQAIEQVLAEHRVRNVLDIGSAEGWFLRRAAERGCFALGVEAGDRLIVGELSRLHDRVEGAAAIRAFLTPDRLHALPKFDAVLCLSVVHHVIRGFGTDAAEAFVKALASRVDKVLIFEIGSAEETSWSAFLPETADGQEGFVRALLRRAGFHKVRVIAETPSYHREANRLLFVAEPLARAEAGTSARALEPA